jgi:hypothetical protein
VRRNYENWLKAFVDYASYGEAPLNMYFWVGVSTIAGALRRCVWIEQKYFQWVPNFYVILVAPPGIVAKSTTASIGMQLLREVPGINFGPDVVTWQALAQALAMSNESILMPDGLLHPMSAITIESSEFGTFLNPSDREMVDLLVSLWDGRKGVFRKLTKTQGKDDIVNPWLNIIACTTPSWIEGNFPEYMVGGGFTSRCVFIYAEKKRQYVAYPGREIPPDHETTKQKLIDDLTMVSQLRGAYSLSADAFEWGEVWYKNHYEHRPKHLDNERFGGYIARKQTHMHKLALIISAAKRQETVITSEELSEADLLLTALEMEMPKVFERIGVSPDARGQSELVSVVRTYGTISYKLLYQQLFRILSYEDFLKALQSATQAGYITQINHNGELAARVVSPTKGEEGTVLKIVPSA